MDIGSVRALVLNSNFSVFGVAAVVTRPAPDDTPISTTVIWVTPVTEDLPFDGSWQRREQRRVLAIRRATVPTVPRGTRIVVKEHESDVDSAWLVDGLLMEETEHVRVFVVPAPEVAP